MGGAPGQSWATSGARPMYRRRRPRRDVEGASSVLVAKSGAPRTPGLRAILSVREEVLAEEPGSQPGGAHPNSGKPGGATGHRDAEGPGRRYRERLGRTVADSSVVEDVEAAWGRDSRDAGGEVRGEGRGGDAWGGRCRAALAMPGARSREARARG